MSKVYLLNKEKFQDERIENLEVFEITYLDFDIDLKKYDALIFTSKNAIYSIERSNKDWINIPSYIIAKSSAKIAQDFGAKIAFIGKSGHGKDFAYELLEVLKNKKVLYLRALKTVSNLTNILRQNNINVDEVIAYKTSCSNNKINPLEKNSIIIFTSPSSVECFFNKYEWDKSFKAIAIGKTTASFLPNYVNFELSKMTSIQECINLALEKLD